MEEDNSYQHNKQPRLIQQDDSYQLEFEDEIEKADLKKNENVELEAYQACNVCCGSLSGCLRAWVPCACCCLDRPFIEVPESSRSIVERFGRPIRILEPGLHQINTCADQVRQVSFKIRILDLPKQKITTKDNITLFVDAVIYYRVLGIMRAVYKIENLQRALLGKMKFDQIQMENGMSDQSVASVRSVLGEMNLQEILSSKEELANRLEYQINDVSKKWGTLVEEIFFKDISLNKETQDDMAATAKQRRLGESKLISNQAEVQAATLLKQTAEILDSKAAMQVRYLEVIQNITKAAPDKVLFLSLDAQKR